MQLKIKLSHPGTADGTYAVKAKGYIMAILYWANENGILPDWTAFAYLPISAGGMGTFKYTGGRAIPKKASCVLARGISADFSEISECITEIPKHIQTTEKTDMVKFAIMSDLHITNKPGRFVRALKKIREIKPDVLLLPGDLVNDGKPEQFALFWKHLSDQMQGISICCATGNHDYPFYPIPQIFDGICNYPILQSRILEWNQQLGNFVEEDKSGACAVQIGKMDIITLNAVSHWRKFIFPNDAQLEWLKQHLDANDSDWHIILCHAPLLRHNPQRRFGYKEPYLSRDGQLQDIIDANKHVIFVSGHTHISTNIPCGCVEFDTVRGNFYVNDGSFCPNDLKEYEPLMPTEWADGNLMELQISSNHIQITSILLHSGKKIARGYYALQTNQ